MSSHTETSAIGRQRLKRLKRTELMDKSKKMHRLTEKESYSSGWSACKSVETKLLSKQS
ncbi:hypothetical protein NQZ68_007418 [Dissostichus eleginoides]|nr:hypothetical protein NQZ68_007418 [Dissostichus eleginoides]